MKRVFIVMALLLMAGCGKADLRHGLTESDADQIIHLLDDHKIVASKEKEVSGQEVTWKVMVPSRSVAESLGILVENNLPRGKAAGLEDIFGKPGLIPTPGEEWARRTLAMKGEIINSLTRIPGVIDADVVLTLPGQDVFSDLAKNVERPTASVVIRASERGLDVAEGKIQRFIANAVPNMNPNDVAVIIARTSSGGATRVSTGLPAPLLSEGISRATSEEALVSPVEFAGLTLETDSIARAKVYFVSLLSLLVFVAGALLVNTIRLNRLRVRLQTAKPVDAIPLRGERPLLGATPERGLEGTFDVGTRERIA